MFGTTDIVKIKKGCKSKFVELRNKVAHGDIIHLQTFKEELKLLLPLKEELVDTYKVKGNPIRWDVASYVQLRKCLIFCLTWENNLCSRARAPTFSSSSTYIHT